MFVRLQFCAFIVLSQTYHRNRFISLSDLTNPNAAGSFPINLGRIMLQHAEFLFLDVEEASSVRQARSASLAGTDGLPCPVVIDYQHQPCQIHERRKPSTLTRHRGLGMHNVRKSMWPRTSMSVTPWRTRTDVFATFFVSRVRRSHRIRSTTCSEAR